MIYDDRWYVAYINEAYPEKSEIAVNFLYPSGPSPSFVYPSCPDMLVMEASDFILQLHPTTKTGRTCYLPEEETRNAMDAFALRRMHYRKALLK